MRTNVLLLVTNAFLAALMVSCAGRGGEKKQAEIPPVPVTAERPVVGRIGSSYKTTAELVSPLATSLSFAAGGRVLELTAEEGDVVAAGQYLGKVDVSVYEAQYAAAESGIQSAESQARAAELAAQAAQAQVETAQAAYEQAGRDLERMQNLYNEGVATQAELERAQLGHTSAGQALQAAKDSAAAAAAQAEAARAGVQAARDSARQVRELIGNASLYAPFRGRIADRSANPGEVVGPGQPVYRIVPDGPSSGRLEVRYDVPESVIGQINIGTPVTLTLLSVPEPIPLTVDSIGPEISSKSRTAHVVSYLEPDSMPVMPGMFGTVSIPLEVRENAILLPERAVIELENVKLVYVAQGDRAARREVTVGLRENGMLEITSGVAPEDLVIVEGNRFLTDGARITVQEPEQGTDGQVSTFGEEIDGAAR